MTITENDMNEFLDKNRDAFLAAAKQSVIDRIAKTMEWNLPDVVNKEITKFLNEEIAPEVAKHLKAEKGPILEAAKVAAVGLSKAMSEKLMETAIKNLNGYKGNDIFKALFGY